MEGGDPQQRAQAEVEARALRRLKAEKGFYVHLTVYAAVIGFLTLMNLTTGRPYWFFWPALGWGLGLAAHALVVFVGASREWERRRLQELIEEERERR
jgi:hypothetical protein